MSRSKKFLVFSVDYFLDLKFPYDFRLLVSDTLTESSVQEALDRLGSQRTVLVIAHRLGTIRNADNIIVLKDGTVAESGAHNELLKLNGIYAEMWNKQLHSASTSDSQENSLEENKA